MDGMLDLLKSFLESFSPSYIYQSAYQVANVYLSVLSGALLLFAIWVRLMNTSLDLLEGQGRYAAFFRSVAVWGAVLGLYFVLIGLVTDLFNVLYAWTRQNGSIGMALHELGVALESMDAARSEAAREWTWYEQLGDFVGNQSRFVAYVFFFLSFLLVVFLQLFFQIAQASGYALALVVGTVAIPLAIASQLSILRGWVLFSVTVLVWPIIESLLMYFIIGMSAALGSDITALNPGNASAGGIYVVFTIMNLVMAAVIIAAPFITWALISNSGSITGMVMPFVGAAMSATATAGRQGMNLIHRQGSGKRSGIGGGTPTPPPRPVNKNATAEGAGWQRVKGVSYSYALATPGPVVVAGVSRAPSAGQGDKPTVSPAEKQTPVKPRPGRSPRAQARRGAIINQNKQRGKK